MGERVCRGCAESLGEADPPTRFIAKREACSWMSPWPAQGTGRYGDAPRNWPGPTRPRARLRLRMPAPKAIDTGQGDHQPWCPSDAIDVAQVPEYRAGMTAFRLAVLVLGVIHALS